MTEVNEPPQVCGWCSVNELDPQPVVGKLSAGCEHEHLVSDFICAEHLEICQPMVELGFICCGPCVEVDGHECVLRLVP